MHQGNTDVYLIEINKIATRQNLRSQETKLSLPNDKCNKQVSDDHKEVYSSKYL